MAKIPVVYSEDFLTNYRTVDCENPERAWIIYAAIKDMAEFHAPPYCMESDLLLCHTESLVRSVERDKEVFSIARKAAGGAIMAAEIALKQPSFALIRPPGHHAGRNFNGGFCFFNNMAIAIYSLLKRGLIANALSLTLTSTMETGLRILWQQTKDFILEYRYLR
jgi:acetoin utilization deacetylase AcuC-like enzyme